MKGINKIFPGVHALKDVDFELYPGEVCGLVGENGAGKSTLMNVLGGVHQADSGTISINGAATERAESYGFQVVFLDAKRDAATQASQVQDVIAQHIDAVMMAPVDAAALSESVKLLNDANIPVTLVDRTVEEGNYVALSESDNVEFGRQAAQLIVDFAQKPASPSPIWRYWSCRAIWPPLPAATGPPASRKRRRSSA
jgi:ATPase subunit of ABC transporter with duplicated ATPase domains